VLRLQNAPAAVGLNAGSINQAFSAKLSARPEFGHLEIADHKWQTISPKLPGVDMPCLTKLLVAVLMLALPASLLACASSESAPAAVLQAFDAQYPGNKPKWEAQPYGYEAVFTKAGLEYEAEYSASGTWLETEYEVHESQFSPAVLQRLKQQYPGYAITKHEIELTPQGTFYEVEIEANGQERELYFDDQANPAVNQHEDI
jgi:hypothetical protein